MSRIIITGSLHPKAFELLDQESDISYDYMPDLEREKLLEAIPEYHCIISRSETTIDKDLIDKGKSLKMISRAAVGVGNIDIDYATSKGIVVINTPGINTNSAAELTLGLMLGCCRKIYSAHSSILDHKWTRHQFTGSELRGKTIGIVGLGNVGSRVARFLHAFDCKLLAYDPYVTTKYCEDYFCQQVNLDELLSHSDIITFHTPLNSKTKGMINEKEFDKMKQGVFIINAARGGIVNEQALYTNMCAGKVAAAGIDTWEVEPLGDTPLRGHPNVLMTPHIGASTDEAQLGIAESVIKETVAGIRGGIVNNPLNLPNIKLLRNNTIIKYSVLAEKLGKITSQYLENDFMPTNMEFLYRGSLNQQDCGLIMLYFIYGYLRDNLDVPVSYVNALDLAKQKGISIKENEDKDFSDYESAIRVRIFSKEKSFVIGGTLLGKDKIRLTYFQDLKYEIEPVGHMLFVENRDTPGMVGHMGVTMQEFDLNINQFYLSRYAPGTSALTVILLDSQPTQAVIDKLLKHENILSVKSINLN